MSKKPFPSIGEEILKPARLKVSLNLTPRSISEETIAESVKTIGEKWGSVTQIPTREPASPHPLKASAPDRSKWPSVRFECPPYLDRELTIAAAQRGHTKTYLILKLLADNGFTVHPEDLIEDKRKLRK